MQLEQHDLSEALSAESVLQFLTSNPEFFNQHSEVLPRLQIPHHTGSAVSLIEKQVSVLRGKCSTLENSLRDLISVARENEQLHHRLHRLIQDIISASSIDNVISLTSDNLLANFNADDVRVVLFNDDQEISSETGELKVIKNDAEGLEVFDELFNKRETSCGEPSETQLEIIFDGDAPEVASMALIPLFYRKKLGLVALTSKDETRFSSGKGVMFLNQLGEVLSRRVDTLL